MDHKHLYEIIRNLNMAFDYLEAHKKTLSEKKNKYQKNIVRVNNDFLKFVFS